MKHYNIAALSHGTKEDKLGDVYEDYCVELLEDNILLEKAQNNSLNIKNTDEYVYASILSKNVIPYLNKIRNITATNNIKHRFTGGNPKTDVIADIETDSGIIHLPISVKQTTAPKVTMAEFDVNTIVSEVKITDPIVIELLEKHQRDASAKNFTKLEKKNMRIHLEPYIKKLVRWVVAGTPEAIDDLRFPELLLKFSLTKNDEITDIKCYTVDEYVDYLVYDKNGNNKKGGFGTGLSWTYATGSKGEKIQFKG
jgi:hypothetical protein